MSQYVKFKTQVSSSKYIFRNGKIGNFVQGIYVTNLPKEIEELREEIAAGNTYFSEIGEVSAVEADPVSRLKEDAIKEFIERQKSAVNPSNDMGTTAQSSSPVVGLATSGNVTAVTVKK